MRIRFMLPLLMIWLAGCGYTQTGMASGNPGYQWKSLYREDIKTVAVPVFSNRTYQRGLEMELTKDIIQQMEEHTPYKVVPRDRADSILEGEITFAQTNAITNDLNTGLPQESLYTIIVTFTWKDLRSGATLVTRKNYDQRTSFFHTLGEADSAGAMIASDNLALNIVQELQADW